MTNYIALVNVFLGKSIWVFAEMPEDHLTKKKKKKNPSPDKGLSVFF